MKHPPPDQYETEKYLSDSLSHGDVDLLAALLKVSPSLISQMFNPHDPKKSWVYQYERLLWACYKIRESLGDAVSGRSAGLRALWKSKGSPVRPDVSRLASRVTSEIADVVIAELERKPVEDRFREAMEAKSALDEYLLGLMQTSDPDGSVEDAVTFSRPMPIGKRTG